VRGQWRGPELFFIHPDHLGTPRAVVDAVNRVQWRWDFASPFGDTVADETLSLQNGITLLYQRLRMDLRFPGQQYDVETGLHYNYFRDYEPGTGRYLQPDPIGLAGGINLYQYVGGNALRYVDPYGLYTFDEFVDDSADFSAGWGDLLSFGITARIREGFDIGSVNKCSAAYKGGEVFGFANGVALGWAQGTKAAAQAASANTWSNFSHSLIPHSAMKGSSNPVVRWMDKVGNRLNGDFVSPELHTRMDAAAQFGLSREWLAANPLFSPLRQLINRVPYVPGAAAYGAGSAAVNSCGCDD
jgi:RHS repeat-associated protein